MPENILHDGPLTAADLRLVDRAIKGGWAIPVRVIEQLPVKLAEDAFNVGADGVAGTGHVDLESQHRAASMLVRMVQQNQTVGPLKVEHSGPGGGPIAHDIVVDIETLTLSQAEHLQHHLEQELGVVAPIAIGHAVIQEDVINQEGTHDASAGTEEG